MRTDKGLLPNIRIITEINIELHNGMVDQIYISFTGTFMASGIKVMPKPNGTGTWSIKMQSTKCKNGPKCYLQN